MACGTSCFADGRSDPGFVGSYAGAASTRRRAATVAARRTTPIGRDGPGTTARIPQAPRRPAAQRKAP
jgi:hypothetical protein